MEGSKGLSTASSPEKSKQQRDSIEEVEREVKNGEYADDAVERNQQGSIWCWNVNGLRAAIRNGSLMNFLRDFQPDVLCLNETKVDAAALEKEKI